jgi:CRISPR/Cas system-associated protein Csx1
MDKIYLQLTNNVEMGIANERLTVEIACMKIAESEDEIKSLENSLANIHIEHVNLRKEQAKSNKETLLWSATLYILVTALFFASWFSPLVDTFLQDLDIVQYGINHGVAMLTLIYILPTLLFIEFLKNYITHHLKLNNMNVDERIEYYTKICERRIERHRESIAENTAKAKQSVENIKELLPLIRQ